MQTGTPPEARQTLDLAGTWQTARYDEQTLDDRTGPIKDLPLDLEALNWRGMGMTEKTFPARATLKNLDPRLRPGMSASVEIIIESAPDRILIPLKASFLQGGKPAVYVQKGTNFEVRMIEVGRRNETELVVRKGLNAGETVALENPIEAAKKAKKL